MTARAWTDDSREFLRHEHADLNHAIEDEGPFRIPTVADIYAWVAAQPPSEIVGTPGDANCCLIARALEVMNPGMEFEVVPNPCGVGDIRSLAEPDMPERKADLPESLNELATRFDDLNTIEEGAPPHVAVDLTADDVLMAWDRLVAR